jgi:aminomethyltransferase
LELKETPFHSRHLALGAKMVAFAGFHMPMEFAGILREHLSVRQGVGIFDVSHMGEISLSGDGALEFADRLTTNTVSKLDPFQAQYTAILNDQGGIIDDLLIYRRRYDYLLVVNAVNTARALEWIRERAPAGVTVNDLSDQTAQIAIQGPRAQELMTQVCGEKENVAGLGYFRAMGARIANSPCLVSRTGYTGEDGFEIYMDAGGAPEVWDALMAGKPEPCGLGARDSLRLEAALRLHGNDMDETTTPLEAGLGWVVKMEKGEFFGREALLRQIRSGVPKRLIGLVTEAKRFPRRGYAVLSRGVKVGEVTSGGFSPSLGCGIALAYVAAELARSGVDLEIDVRGKIIEARYHKGPFYKRPKGK